MRLEAEILAGVPYEISIYLDWSRGLLELFIDGASVLQHVPFQAHFRVMAFAGQADLVPRYIGSRCSR